MCPFKEIGSYAPAHLHQELVMKLPMSGDHKVFQLPKDVHKAARKTAKKGPVV